MSKVNRYDCDRDGDEYECEGPYVKYEDYLALLARHDALKKAAGEMAAHYEEAIEEIQHWGGYASSYFKDKHDLAGNIKTHTEALAAYRAATGEKRDE